MQKRDGARRGAHLDLGGDEERRDADELQVVLVDVLLSQHEAVEEVLGQVGGLPVEAVHLAHLQQTGVRPARLQPSADPAENPTHLEQPVQQDGPHLGLQPGVPLQVALVVDVLQLLVEHLDPDVVGAGPAANKPAP